MNKSTVVVGMVICFFIALFWLRRSHQTDGAAEEFPIIYNVANFMNVSDLQEVGKMISDKGEKYVISIAVVSSNNAQVHVGDRRFLEPGSGRVYKVARTEGAWKIEDVESWKH